MSRIIFVEKMKHHIMMGMYNNVNVVLDSFFGGDTTSREAFEIGAPIVTLPHKYLGNRWTYAYYKIMGINDMIANSPQNYVDIAVSLATDQIFYKEMKKKILDSNSIIYNNKDASLYWSELLISIFN